MLAVQLEECIKNDPPSLKLQRKNEFRIAKKEFRQRNSELSGIWYPTSLEKI